MRLKQDDNLVLKNLVKKFSKKKKTKKKKTKKTQKDHTTNIGEIENKFTTDHDHYKYITTQEFNKLTVENFIA